MPLIFKPSKLDERWSLTLSWKIAVRMNLKQGMTTLEENLPT